MRKLYILLVSCLLLFNSCLQLNSSNITNVNFKLQWTIPIGNVTNYKLYIKHGNDIKHIIIDRNIINYNIKELTLISNNEYEFWVAALYGDIEGKPSNKIKYIK